MLVTKIHNICDHIHNSWRGKLINKLLESSHNVQNEQRQWSSNMKNKLKSIFSFNLSLSDELYDKETLTIR